MTDMEPSCGSGAASRSESVEGGSGPASGGIEDARARLARVDELPVSERAQLLAAVNELIVAELAAMDEGGEAGLGAGAAFAVSKTATSWPRPRAAHDKA